MNGWHIGRNIEAWRWRAIDELHDGGAEFVTIHHSGFVVVDGTEYEAANIDVSLAIALNNQ